MVITKKRYKIRNKTKTSSRNKTKTSSRNKTNKKTLKNNGITQYLPSHLTHLSHLNTTDSKHLSKRLIPLIKLKGGRYIDKGGFGCVITPAIPCSKADKNLDESVSKVIRDPDDDIKNEIIISNILKSIDKEQQYFITYNKYCYLTELPEGRTDITDVKYKDADFSRFSLKDARQKKTMDNKFCDVDLNKKPVNIIMPYAGYSLSAIMKSNRKNQGLLPKMNQMFVDGLKKYFKHLLIGLRKMHENRLVNRDIKEKNITVALDANTNSLKLRYIDFGLTQFLTSDFESDLENISSDGTYFYMSPEIFISRTITKYPGETKSYHMRKIMQKVENDLLVALRRIDENVLLDDIEGKIESLYEKILNLFINGKLAPVFFGTAKNKFNGYLQKADVYALGLTIYDCLYTYSKIDVKRNKNLRSLLLNMLNLNADKRYNVEQCLSHEYFRN